MCQNVLLYIDYLVNVIAFKLNRIIHIQICILYFIFIRDLVLQSSCNRQEATEADHNEY